MNKARHVFHADNVYLSRVPVPALTLIPMKQWITRVTWLAPYFNVSFRPPLPFSHRCLCLKTINISSSNKCIKTFFLWSDGKRSNSICPADKICFSSSCLTETSHSSRSNISIWLCRQSCSAKWSPTSFLEVTVGIVDGVLFAVKVLLRPNFTGHLLPKCLSFIESTWPNKSLKKLPTGQRQKAKDFAAFTTKKKKAAAIIQSKVSGFRLWRRQINSRTYSVISKWLRLWASVLFLRLHLVKTTSNRAQSFLKIGNDLDNYLP